MANFSHSLVVKGQVVVIQAVAKRNRRISFVFVMIRRVAATRAAATLVVGSRSGNGLRRSNERSHHAAVHGRQIVVAQPRLFQELSRIFGTVHAGRFNIGVLKADF